MRKARNQVSRERHMAVEQGHLVVGWWLTLGSQRRHGDIRVV